MIRRNTLITFKGYTHNQNAKKPSIEVMLYLLLFGFELLFEYLEGIKNMFIYL